MASCGVICITSFTNMLQAFMQYLGFTSKISNTLILVLMMGNSWWTVLRWLHVAWYSYQVSRNLVNMWKEYWGLILASWMALMLVSFYAGIRGSESTAPPFLTSKIDASEWFAFRPSQFNTGEIAFVIYRATWQIAYWFLQQPAITWCLKMSSDQILQQPSKIMMHNPVISETTSHSLHIAEPASKSFFKFAIAHLSLYGEGEGGWEGVGPINFYRARTFGFPLQTR
jgi:hypothetical protein